MYNKMFKFNFKTIEVGYNERKKILTVLLNLNKLNKYKIKFNENLIFNFNWNITIRRNN